jgi:hypothetical protein
MLIQKITKHKNIIDKTLAIIYILIYIVLTLDFGYIKINCPKVKTFVKICTTLQMLFYSISLVTLYSLNKVSVTGTIWICFHVLQYCLNSFILRIFQYENTFLHKNDFLSVEIDYLIKIKFIISALLAILYRLIYFICFCVYFGTECGNTLFSILLVIQLISLDAVILECSLLFYNGYCRMKVLNNNVITRGNQILDYIQSYKRIIRNVSKTKKVVDYLVSK